MRRRVLPGLLLLAAIACSFPDYRTAETPAQTTTCENGVRDGDESGVDCGPGCEPCTTCNNGVQDSAETGIDCGGNCAPCPSCEDSKRNGSESDVDCGGTCPERCDTNQRCVEASDCASLVCATVCQPATCTDDVLNGAETTKDCGGGACPDCVNGEHCLQDRDCQTGLCQQELCVSPACSNGSRDNDETDVDCGGPACTPCPDQSKCLLARDCASNECDGGVCTKAVKTCAGYALSFDGDDFVKVNRPVQDDFTIEAWLKTTATQLDGNHYWNGAGLFWSDVIGDSDDFGASVLGSRIAFGTGRAAGGEVNLIGSVTVNSGAWTHVAVTRRKTAEELQIFINGALDRSVTDASQTNSLTASASLQIGGNSNDKRYYQGLIDEVRVWNVVRSAAELDENKSRTLAGSETGLVGYWRFDEASGVLANDSGPAQNHGILQGPPQWILSDAPICP